MLNFDQLVKRADHRPYVQSFSTTGSRSVAIADLNYFEPTTVQRQVAEAVISIQLVPTLLRAEMAGKRRAPRVYRRGLFDVTPPDTIYASERPDPGRAIALSIPPKVIKEVLEEVAPDFNSDFASLHDRPHKSELLLAICSQLLAEVSNGSQSGPLYADSLIQALMFELYRVSKKPVRPNLSNDVRLSQPVLQRIDDFIEQNTMAVIELRQLAAIAQMTPSSFMRLFKRSTGQTPYQYVLLKRVESARQLIEHSTLSLAQVAYECGFSSQAHMTDMFRNKIGVTPGQLRG